MPTIRGDADAVEFAGGSVCVSVVADSLFAECARETVLSVLDNSDFDVHLSVIDGSAPELPRTRRLRLTELGATSRPGERAWPMLLKFWALQRCLAWTGAQTVMLLDADAVFVQRLGVLEVKQALGGRALGMMVQASSWWDDPRESYERYVQTTHRFLAPSAKPPPFDRFRFYNAGVVLGARAELERLCSWAIEAVTSAGRRHMVGRQKIADQAYLQFWANEIARERTTPLPWSWNHAEVWHPGYPRPGARILHFSNLARGPTSDTAVRMRAARQAERPTVSESHPLITVLGELPEGADEPLEPQRVLVLSRFMWLRCLNDTMVAETSLGPCAVRIEDPRVHALMFSFASPSRLDAAAQTAELELARAREVGSVLLAAGLLVDPEASQREREPPLAMWEFHDLLFHARSRPGRHRNPSGGTYRFVQKFSPAPAIPPARCSEEVTLPRVDSDRLEREDPPLSLVQSARTSVREYGQQPISASELGEFLFRVGRVEDVWQTPLPSGGAAGSMTYAAKPYPSGGALYELELYTAIQACQGVDPGLYHYAADRHVLERVAQPTATLDEVITQAAGAMAGTPEAMQIVIVITARTRRTAWKYESLAYSLALKHVGVVLQTMYLTATAMGLAPCALGAGNSDLFAQASGIDFYEEPAVGEFALGSRRSSPPLGL